MKIRNARYLAAGLALAGGASVVQAGASLGTNTVTLFGQSFVVESWDVSGDGVEPEGFAYDNGQMWVVGSGNGFQIANYDLTPDGDLSGGLTDVTPVDMELDNGITINTSLSGYGGAAGQIVTLLDDDGYGVIDLPDSASTKPVIHFGDETPDPAGFSADDIAYVPSRDQFVLLGDRAGGQLDFYNHDGTTLTHDTTIDPVAEAIKGVAVIPRNIARLLTGDNSLTDVEYLLLVSEPSETDLTQLNRLWVTDLDDGSAIGGVQPFDPLGVADAGSLEAVGYDPVNRRVYIGDSSSEVIHTFVVPEPASAALLAIGGLLALRRRN